MALLTGVRVASVGAGFVTSVIGARLIGADGLGTAGAALTLATIGALVANGGLNIATIYLLGRRPAERVVIVARIAVLSVVAAGLAAVLTLAAALLLRSAVLGGASVALGLVTAGLAAGILLFELSGGVLLGLHRRGTFIGTQLMEALASLILTGVILAAISRSPGGFLAAAALGYLLGIAFAGFDVRRQLGRLPLGISGPFTREVLGIGLRGQVGNILQFLNLRLDLLLIPALLNLSAAGLYLVAVRISEVLTQVSSSAASFLFPHVAAQSERTATATTERTMRMTLLVVLGGGLILAIAAEPLLSVAFGAEFASAAPTLRIMLLAMIPLSVLRLLAGDLKGRGRPGLVSVAAFVAVIATVVFDLWLIPVLGIEGAALASLFTYATGALFLLAAYRRLTGGAFLALVPGLADVQALARHLGGLLRRAQSREHGAGR